MTLFIAAWIATSIAAAGTIVLVHLASSPLDPIDAAYLRRNRGMHELARINARHTIPAVDASTTLSYGPGFGRRHTSRRVDGGPLEQRAAHAAPRELRAHSGVAHANPQPTSPLWTGSGDVGVLDPHS
jgi:hypothetical protein